MKIYLDCYPCFLRQALVTARGAGADEVQQYAVVQRVLGIMGEIGPELTPPEIGTLIHRIVCDTVSVADPYRKAKADSTAKALALYPELKRLVAESADPLDMAIRISIAGNIIDFGVRDHIDDLEEVLARVIRQPYAIDDTGPLRRALDEADQVLFLADNAGETVFDRVLIETLPMPVVYVLKGGPIINDATLEDAFEAGLDRCAILVSNGAEAAGTILSLCSDDFCRRFEAAALVIAKGQANYETLSEAGEKVFCLLQVKCPVIAADTGVPVGSIVVRQSTI